MKAMLLERVCGLAECTDPLAHREVPEPTPGPGEILVRVGACGVCHTDLDVIEGRPPPGPLPPGARAPGGGQRRGVRTGGLTIYEGRPGGGGLDRLGLRDEEAAPLLCAGAIGWRALRPTGMKDGGVLGLTGFGASGHLVLQMVRARFPRSRVSVFSRTAAEQAFARDLGADWAGGVDEAPPEPLDAAIDTTPAWRPVVSALGHLAPGGRLVVNAIRKEEGDKEALLDLDWPRHLWMEKELVSVANITRQDVGEFLAFAVAAGIRPHVEEYSLAEANRALRDLKERRIRGARVLRT